MDKQFYEGTIKSYDSLKSKHVILHDDGDIEIIRLEKERWELIDKGHKATKKKNPQKLSLLLKSHLGINLRMRVVHRIKSRRG